jgi:NAD(P)-dependent dehydrogenase (short-subunit alcohol dehydrogenase family)
MDTKASTLDPALLQLVTEMNLFGTVYSCNAVAPVMKQQRSGKIITVSSVAGTAPSADGGYESRIRLHDPNECPTLRKPVREPWTWVSYGPISPPGRGGDHPIAQSC